MTVLMITYAGPHSPNCPLHRKFYYVNFILQNIDVTGNSVNKKKLGRATRVYQICLCAAKWTRHKTSQQLNTGCQINGIAGQSGGGWVQSAQQHGTRLNMGIQTDQNATIRTTQIMKLLVLSQFSVTCSLLALYP